MLASGQIQEGKLVSFGDSIMHADIDRMVYESLLKDERYELLAMMKKASAGLLVGKKIIIHSPHRTPEIQSKIVEFFQRCGVALEGASK